MAKKRTWGRWQNSGRPPKEGGQGRVFVVVDGDSSNGEMAALKELKNPRRVERFNREVQAFAKVDGHPNVTVIIDSALEDDVEKKYYVMELADSSLEDIIATIKHDTCRVLALFEGICSGAAHLHTHGILHRDIKPGNVLLFGDTPKLSDLGLCLISGEDRVTSTDEAVGPRYFMAPELEDGRNPDVDARADVYSLGKLLYYLLSGGRVYSREKRYFGNERLSELLADRRYTPFDRLLGKCITERPQNRFRSALELLEGFDEACKAFFAHPRSTLIGKIPDPLSTVAGTDLSGFQLLTKSELKELLLMMRESETTPSNAVLGWFSERSADGYVEELMGVLSRVMTRAPSELIGSLAARVMKHEEGWALFGTGCTEEEREELAYRAIVHGEDADVLKMAAHNQFPGMPTPKVAVEIQKRFNSMAKEDQQAFVALTAQVNWEGKCDWLYRELNRFRQDEVLFEGALSSLFRFGDDAVQVELVKLAAELQSVAEVAAYGRAMVGFASASVVDDIKQLGSLDPRLKVLVDVRQQVDSDKIAECED